MQLVFKSASPAHPRLEKEVAPREGCRAYRFYRSRSVSLFGSIQTSEKIKNWNFPNFTHPPSRVHMAHTHMSAERKFSCTAFSFMCTLMFLFSFHWEILSNIPIDLKITAKATQISLTCFTLLTFLSRVCLRAPPIIQKANSAFYAARASSYVTRAFVSYFPLRVINFYATTELTNTNQLKRNEVSSVACLRVTLEIFSLSRLSCLVLLPLLLLLLIHFWISFCEILFLILFTFKDFYTHFSSLFSCDGRNFSSWKHQKVVRGLAIVEL